MAAIAQMFLYPPNVDLRDQPHRERKAFLILNARGYPDWAATERRTLSIAGRAISSMIKYSGTNDIMRIYYTTQRDGVDYNLAYIDDDFAVPHPADEFDKAYMNEEYDYAYRLARLGYPWKKAPPGLIPAPASPVDGSHLDGERVDRRLPNLAAVASRLNGTILQKN